MPFNFRELLAMMLLNFGVRIGTMIDISIDYSSCFTGIRYKGFN